MQISAPQAGPAYAEMTTGMNGNIPARVATAPLMMVTLVMALLIAGAVIAKAQAEERWGGTWFTCEFARSQTPPAPEQPASCSFPSGRPCRVRRLSACPSPSATMLN